MDTSKIKSKSSLATKPLTRTKGPIKLIRCSNCNTRFDLDKASFVSRVVGDNLKEIGLECPNCGEWYHSYFLNKDLENPVLRNRKEQRAYKAKFDKFQKRTRKKMGLRRVNGRWVKGESRIIK